MRPEKNFITVWALAKLMDTQPETVLQLSSKGVLPELKQVEPGRNAFLKVDLKKFGARVIDPGRGRKRKERFFHFEEGRDTN